MTASPDTVPTEPAGTIARAIANALGLDRDVAAVYLFGSQARGDARPESDIDLGLVFRARKVGAERFGTVADRIAEAVVRATGNERIDVVDLSAQGPIFAHRVLLEGKLVFEADRERRIDFVGDTLARAFDFRPTYEIATRGKADAVRRALREGDLLGGRR